MRRKIFLVRHGESADRQHSQTDFDRVLTEQGRKSIQQLGKFFKQQGFVVDSFISSSAQRTKETAGLIAKEIGYSSDLMVYEASLYNGSEADYWNMIHQSRGTLILVGHNPSISSIIGKIAGDYSISLLPGQCASLEFDNAEKSSPGAQLIPLYGPFH